MRRTGGVTGGILLISVVVLLLAAGPVGLASVQSQGLPTPTPVPGKGTTGAGSDQPPPPPVPDIVFDGRLNFIDFYADWCGPCIDMRPNIDRMEGRYGPMVHFWRVDVDTRESDRLEAYFGGVPAIPLVVVLDAQGGILVRMEGFQSERQLDQLLRELFARTGTRKPERPGDALSLPSPNPPGPGATADEQGNSAPPYTIIGGRRPTDAVYPHN